MEKPVGHLCALVGNAELWTWRIEYSSVVDRLLERECRNFWPCVAGGEEPRSGITWNERQEIDSEYALTTSDAVLLWSDYKERERWTAEK